jgi:hypothetical protein
MNSKKEYLKDLSSKRELNRISLNANIKKEYYPSDNDLAWKLYVAFPGHFSDSERKKLLKFVVSHMTQICCFGFRRDINTKEIVEMLRLNLKEQFDMHLSKKTLLRFVRAIEKLDRWNS